MNDKYIPRMKPLIGTAPNGREYYFLGGVDVAEKLGIPRTAVAQALRHEVRTYGWKFRRWAGEPLCEFDDFTEDLRATAVRQKHSHGRQVNFSEDGEVSESRKAKIRAAANRTLWSVYKDMPQKPEPVEPAPQERNLETLTRTLPKIFDGVGNDESVTQERREEDKLRAKRKRIAEGPHYTGFYSKTCAVAVLPISGMVVHNNKGGRARKMLAKELEGRDWVQTVDLKILVAK